MANQGAIAVRGLTSPISVVSSPYLSYYSQPPIFTLGVGAVYNFFSSPPSFPPTYLVSSYPTSGTPSKTALGSMWVLLVPGARNGRYPHGIGLELYTDLGVTGRG